MSNPLDDALAELKRERIRLEEHLAAVSASGDIRGAFAASVELRAAEIRHDRIEGKAKAERVRDAAAEALSGLFTTPETLTDVFEALEHDDGTASTSSTSGPPADDFEGNPDADDLRAIFG